MEYEKAKLEHIRLKKIDIRNRLHKYNPDKYPAVESYPVMLAVDVEFTLAFHNPNKPSLFERDSTFYTEIMKRKRV